MCLTFLPIAGEVKIKSPFGKRGNPKKMHAGLDIIASVGTDIFSSGAGTIIRASDNPGNYGNVVVIDHGIVDGP